MNVAHHRGRHFAVFLAGLIVCGHLKAADLFYTLDQYKVVLGAEYGPDNIDQVFFTQDIVKQLSNVKRVRMLPRPGGDEEGELRSKFEQDAPLKDDLARMPGIVGVPAELFRPVLRLAADYANYGDQSACMFQTGAIVLVGDDEPDFILYFCFTCHDVIVVCRPNKDLREVFAPKYRMSPELESAVFELAKKMFPGDTDLQKFVLKKRTRSPHPPKRAGGEDP